MNRRMNKNELLKLLELLKIDTEEFLILSSSSLVLREIYPDAGDLDIAVTDKGLEQLKKKKNYIPNIKNKFAILLPTILPILISECPSIEAVELTISSGIDVPIATIVKPIIIVGI